jgi:hypothetical protein
MQHGTVFAAEDLIRVDAEMLCQVSAGPQVDGHSILAPAGSV